MMSIMNLNISFFTEIFVATISSKRQLFSKIVLVLLLALTTVSCASKDDTSCEPISEILDSGGSSSIVDQDSPLRTTIDNKGIMTWILTKVHDTVEGSTERIFSRISNDEEYRNILGMLLTLAVMFYSLAVALGMAQANAYSLTMFFLKAVLVYLFATNWHIFRTFAVEPIESFINDTIAYTSGIFHKFSNKEEVFSGIDRMIDKTWSPGIIKLIMALTFSGSNGFFYGLMLFAMIFVFLMASIMAVKVYLLALIARYVLYAMGPIFISFALFNQTKSLFDGYVEQLINFTMQPVFLFIFLGMFGMVFYGFFDRIYLDQFENLDSILEIQMAGNTAQGGIGVANACIKSACADSAEKLSAKEGECSFYKYVICSDENNCDVKIDLHVFQVIDIWVIVSCIILGYLMYAMLSWITAICGRLSNGLISLSDVPIQGVSQIKEKVKTTVKQQANKVIQDAVKGGKAKRN